MIFHNLNGSNKHLFLQVLGKHPFGIECIAKEIENFITFSKKGQSWWVREKWRNIPDYLSGCVFWTAWNSWIILLQILLKIWVRRIFTIFVSFLTTGSISFCWEKKCFCTTTLIVWKNLTRLSCTQRRNLTQKWTTSTSPTRILSALMFEWALLADVFKKFLAVSLPSDWLDPAHYFLLPGFL